jgi:hypothetical protein
MIIKRGTVVSHSGAAEWGVGKVLEVAALKATIQFSDGITRKIASSHFAVLHPANPACFEPPAETIKAVKARPATRKPKKSISLPSEP